MKAMLKLLPAAILSVLVIGAPAHAAKAEKCAIDDRRTKAVSEQVGRRIQRAFEAYSEDLPLEALEILNDIRTRNDFDRAFVDRFLGNIYASQSGKSKLAMKSLKAAVDTDELSGTDHAQALKLLADLQIQEKQFELALANYQDWMAFTCKEDGATYLRMASAHFELKHFEQVTPLADKSIALFEEPNRGPYALKMGSYYETKQYGKAALVIEQMVNLFPGERRLWVQLGQMYMLDEQHDKSLYTLDAAYRAGYLESEGEFKMLAQLYAQNQQPYQSARLQLEYLKAGTVKRDQTSLALLANTYHMAKEIDLSVKYYGEAAKLSNDSRHYMRQANLQLQSERYADAKKSIRAALKADNMDDPAAATLLLAQAHFYLGEYTAAHKQALNAAEDENTAHTADSWASYIKEAALRNNIKL